MLNAATDINEMRVPPSTHLEKLAGIWRGSGDPGE